MTCPRCGSNNIYVQAVNEQKLKNAHHGLLWWLFVGWWWFPFKWIVLTIPTLFVTLFIPKNKKIVNTTVTKCVCQNCGNIWNR